MDWRQRAREVILRVLGTLPVDLPYKEKRQAVSAAYPFGMRTNHPYKIWCSEVNRLLPKPRKKLEALRSRFVLREQSRTLEVVCDWCGRHKKKCMWCADLWNRLREILLDPTWQGLSAKAGNGDAVAWAVLCDWLTDRGIEWEDEV